MRSLKPTPSTAFVFLLSLVALSPWAVNAQRLSKVLEHVKVISDRGSTVGGYKHHHPQFQEPIIRTKELVENALENAYWIDFHDQFAQQAHFLELVKSHPGITLRHEFWDSLNAVSLTVRDESVLQDILKQIQGIKMVEPVVMHDRPDVNQETVQVFGKGVSNIKQRTVHDLTGVKEVHETLKLFGQGIKIGIIDSGIDYNHPALGGCFGPGCKVAYGTDFVGDDGKSPDDDPMTQCDGHGTHVAGIIAANDTTFIGVAPQATLGAYRVFGCKGGTSNDLIMKALLRAAADGMQVINLSLGGPGGWRQDREARLADELARNGTLIVAAMGNEGQMGLFESSSPGVGNELLTVASTENEFRSNLYFTVDMPSAKNRHSKRSHHHHDHHHDDDDDEEDHDDEDKETAKGAHSGDQDDGQPRPILYIGDSGMDLTNVTLVQIAPGTSGKVKGDACEAITKDLTGKIALIRRGECTFKIKVANAAKAKASAVIIMDNVPSAGLAADTEGATIKVRTITLDDGEYLLKMIKELKKETEGLKLIAGNGPKRVANPNSGYLSLFSSMGPDSELNSKPDIAAPGGQIWSTFPMKLGSYASLSGTSMATPYVVGCVALYLQGLPAADHSAGAIKTAFQNSARPRKQQKGFDGLASVAQQGAGLLNLMDVLSTKSVVTPSRISLNDTVHLNANQQLTITNSGPTAITYQVDIVPAAGLQPFDKDMMIDKDPQKVTAEAKVEISSHSVTVEPGSSATVHLKFKGPGTDPSKYVIYSGYIRLQPSKVSNQTPILHVPYMGMQGDYKKVHVLDPAFGLRIFDPLGRPLRPVNSDGSHSRGGSGRHGHGRFGHEKPTIHVAGMISNKIATTPDLDDVGAPNDFTSPPTDTDTPPPPPPPSAPPAEDEGQGRTRPGPKTMNVVFRMVTASEILVLDLVSDKGDDPYKVKSYGVLKNGIARYIPRNDQVEGNAFQVMGWDGQILTKDGTVTSVPSSKTPNEGTPQNYRLRISLLKHFGNPQVDRDFEVHLSEPFGLH
ncbi:hypothetical protein BGZ67_000284 [Mortierella alpina]|nr:hypothetical protein BGZ67_000284 [Mortierella alpina]